MIALYNPIDVAVRPIDDSTELSRKLRLRDNDSISSSAKGTVELLGREVNKHTDFNVGIGDVVYFDPRFVCEVKELGLLVMDYKSLLIKEQ
jgi:hypothetical protein